MPNGKTKILMLMVAPSSLKPLDLEKEAEKIVANIWGAKHRDQFEVVAERAVRRSDFINLLHRHRPHVVHFSGHGSEGAIFLVSEDDKHAPVSAQALRAIFAEFSDTVRLVFLNACYTKAEAEAIAEVIDCALGTERGISDRAAIAFAACFYSTLAYGSTIGRAFNLGKAQLMTEELQAEAEVKLLAKFGVDPYRVRLVEAPSAASAEGTVVPEIETDPTGRVYLSYAPSRLPETRLIASALRDRGIPLCEEALADDRHLMDASITEVLRSPGTASGLVVLTPEAVDSRAIKTVELPVMLERAGHGNSFFIVATQYADAELGELGVQLHSRGIRLHKVPKKKSGPPEAATIAKLVLEQRIAAIHKALHPTEPLRLELYTRAQPPSRQGTALLIDWTERFSPRLAAPENWDQYLLPALRDIVRTIETKAPGRAVEADGRLSLPAAIAFGCSFIQPKDIRVRWTQHTTGRRDQFWSIDVPRKSFGLKVETSAYQPDGNDLAVLVSVAAPAEQAFESSRPDLPPFRAIVRAWKTPFGTESLASPGQAADAAFKVRDAVREARATYPRLGAIHLFMAVPAGLAMMIGQLLNVLGPVQTYDLESPDAGGRYRAAALLKPCD